MSALRTSEIYRYLGYRGITQDPEMDARIAACTEKLMAASTPRVIHEKFPVTAAAADTVRIGELEITSHSLYQNLSDCTDAYMFSATVGIGIDRLIRRAEISSMTDALIFQAVGAEMIETYADTENEKLRQLEAAAGNILKPRFSPGYGDLPLALQTDFFRILPITKRCGITLTDTLLMVPSKSITAFIGVKPGNGSPVSAQSGSPSAAVPSDDAPEHSAHNCQSCTLQQCAFRV